MKDALKTLTDAVGSRDLAMTDTGFARVLAHLHAQRLRYVEGLGWYVWRRTEQGGGYWGADRGEVEVARLLDQTVGLYLRAAHELARSDGRAAERLARFALGAMNNGRKNAILREAARQPALYCAEYPFDHDPHLLNTQNGVVDLRTGELRDATPDMLCARITHAAYDPTARADRWTRFLGEVFGDAELVTFARRWLGYCLTASNREQRYLVAWGAGANGKSTLFETVLHVLGDYGTTLRPDVITLRRDGGDVPTPALAELVGRRLAVLPEWVRGRAVDEVLLKSIVGGDTVQGRRLYGEPFYFKATAKLVIYGNAKPELRGRDWGTWRRVLLLPFSRRFGTAERPADPRLAETLAGEAGGILTDLVLAARDWFEHGLGVPKVVQDATNAYRVEQDDVTAFLAHMCTRSEGTVTRVADLWNAYVEWGGEIQAAHHFSRALRELGYVVRRDRQGAYLKDIALKD